MLISTDSEYLAKLGTLSEAQEAAIEKLIAAKSQAVERWCRRTFAATDHDEIQIAGEMGFAFLDNFPVLSVDRICTQRAEAIRLVNGTATAATVTTSDSRLRLTSVIDGLKTTTAIDYSDATTLDDLATAVVGAGNGWSATVAQSYLNHPSNDLIRGQFKNCRTQTGLWLWLDSSEDCTIDEAKGIVTTSAPEVRVCYRAGYESIPADLQQVVAEMVLASWDRSLGTIQSESLGDYSVSYATGSMNELPLKARQVLSTYRDRRP